MPSRKTRPPRIYLDKRTKKFYIIQNKVKRFIEESDFEKIAQAVKSGELAYKTTKKGPTWLDTFKPMDPVNTDPIERRRIEKSRWDMYGSAVDRYKKDIADYQKRQGELIISLNKKSDIKEQMHKSEVKFDFAKVEKYNIVKNTIEDLKNSKEKNILGDLKFDEPEEDKYEHKYDEPEDKDNLGNGLSNEEREELAQRIEEENNRLEAIEKELNDEYTKNLALFNEQKELEHKYLNEDLKASILEGSDIGVNTDKVKKIIESIDDVNTSIITAMDKIKKSIGIVQFYEFKIPDMVWNDELKTLKQKKIDLQKEYDEQIKDIKDPEKPKAIATTNDEEKKLVDFLLTMTAKDMKNYMKIVGLGLIPYTNKRDSVSAMLADPKMSKLIQLAYVEYINPANKLDFLTISTKLRHSVIGFGENDEYDGLYGDEILKIMRPYKGFLGVIMNDEIPNIIEASLHYDRFGFVINKDNSNLEGSHWCAIFVDIPDGSIEYFDSFGDEPTPEVTKDMMELIKEHEINYLMKFKVNGTKVQDLRTGSCGWFAMKFLIDRFNNVPFAQASGFTIKSIGSKKGESKVNVMKKSFGYI